TKSPAGAGLSREAGRAASGGGLQRLDPRAQAALVASGLVAVDQAARAEAVEQLLGSDEGSLRAGGVGGVERLDHLLERRAERRALAAVALVAHDGLLGALLGRLDVGHDGILESGDGGARTMTGPGNGITGAIPVENTSEQEIMGDSMGWVN